MGESSISVGLDKAAIFQELTRILENLINDYDTDFSGGITPETYLIQDLYLDSLTIVMLILEIEGRFKRQGLPFDEILIKDGERVTDLQVAELVDFLYKHLNA